MSITEQIAVLESEKRTCIQQFDQQVTDLKIQQPGSNDQVTDEPDEVVLPSGRRLIQSKGRTLSQVILEDRAPTDGPVLRVC